MFDEIIAALGYEVAIAEVKEKFPTMAGHVMRRGERVSRGVYRLTAGAEALLDLVTADTMGLGLAAEESGVDAVANDLALDIEEPGAAFANCVIVLRIRHEETMGSDGRS